MALFTRFGLGHLLCKLSLEKEAGIPAVQLILSLCLFRMASESIHSMYKNHITTCWVLARTAIIE